MKTLNPNIEIRNKSKIQNSKPETSYVSNIRTFGFRICLEFRASNVGFKLAGGRL